MKKGENMSDEQRQKIAKAHLGMKASKEARLKMSLAKLGKPSWNKGKSSPWAGKNGFKKGLVPWNKKYEIYEEGLTQGAITQRIRRRRRSDNGGSHTKSEWESLKKLHSHTCLGCSKQEPEIKLTRDHILAICKGGSDDITNIQPLCQRCNSKKWKHNTISRIEQKFAT